MRLRKPVFRPAFRALSAGLALIALATSSLASPYRLIEGSADGGGGHSQGSRFAVEGTIGQSDAGDLAGQRFALEGGFWRPASPDAPNLPDSIFSTSFED